MSPSQLERYLHKHIPLSRAMQVRVIEVGADKVVISAPLAPNINHRETVFGGSASAVAILAAWSLLHTRLAGEGIACRVVIQRNTMSYGRPISGTFTATSGMAYPDEFPRFLRTLDRKGKARTTVTCELHFAGEAVGHFDGEFVALGI